MKTKDIIIIILAVLLVIVAGALFFNYRNSILHMPVKQNPPGQVSIQIGAINDVMIKDTTKPFTINVVYPQITGQDNINQKIVAIINNEIATFKSNSLANGQQMQQNDPADYAKYPPAYDLEISYTKGEIDQNVISLVFNVYNFEGGANGENYFIPFNYDVKDNKEIALADLFSGQPDYLQKISDFCISNLTQQIIKGAGSTQGTWIQEGAGPQLANYSVFLVNTNSIVFYFAQAQVAAASFGEYQVTYPR